MQTDTLLRLALFTTPSLKNFLFSMLVQMIYVGYTIYKA